MSHRVGVVGLWHETNEYSSRPASLAQWEEYELLEGPDVVAAHGGTRSVVGGFLDALGERAIPVFVAGAWPSGPTPAPDFEVLLARIRHGLAEAGRLDAIALNLHGAMVVDGYTDPEATVLEAVRDIVGDVPVGVVEDLHGNPTERVVALADVVVGYQTYPHVDMWECGATAVELIDRMLDGERFVTSIAKLPYLTCPLVQGTDGALGEVIGWANRRAADLGVTRVSVMAGFAYQDSARAGMSVMAVAREDDRASAELVATETAQRIRDLHESGAFALERPDPVAAVALADAATAHPVVLVDLADNIGAGSAGDGTVILAELLRASARGAVVALADPDVARTAHDVGIGATIDALVGGKTDDLHGEPVRVVARVDNLTDGTYVSAGSWGTGQTFGMGKSAVLDVDGLTLVVTERATPPFHRESLTSVGVDPASARIIVAKAAVAWRAAFGDDARTVIEVDAPGACPVDPSTLPRRHRPVTVMPAVTPRTTRRAAGASPQRTSHSEESS